MPLSRRLVIHWSSADANTSAWAPCSSCRASCWEPAKLKATLRRGWGCSNVSRSSVNAAMREAAANTVRRGAAERLGRGWSALGSMNASAPQYRAIPALANSTSPLSDHDFSGLDDREYIVADLEPQSLGGRTSDDRHQLLIADPDADLRHHTVEFHPRYSAPELVARADLHSRAGGARRHRAQKVLELIPPKEPLLAHARRGELAGARQLLHPLYVQVQHGRSLCRTQKIHICPLITSQDILMYQPGERQDRGE